MPDSEADIDKKVEKVAAMLDLAKWMAIKGSWPDSERLLQEAVEILETLPRK